MLAAVCAMLALNVFIAFRHQRIAREELAGPRAYVSEGRVEHFVPEAWGGHSGGESFYVDGARFSYSQFEDRGSFHQATSHGGPIREGLPVRITHVADRILRLEVASPEGEGGLQRVDDAARR